MVFSTLLLETLNSAQKVAVLTGAGISAESGIPTFREAQTGLWSKYRPEDLATPSAFRRDPKLVWEWYQWRRQLIEQSNPNPGHHAIAQFEGLVPSFTVITQNVDGFHQSAGSSTVIELHGNIMRTICFDNRHKIDEWDDYEIPPRCPICRSYLRPDVVWFGEGLPKTALENAIQETRECNVFLAIGTSAVVEPAASLPWIAKENGALLIEVNPNTTPVTRNADYVFHKPAGEFLPELVHALAT